jgi:hypothetical protein
MPWQEFNCVTFGLPWWTSIMVTTVALRMCVLPFALQTIRNNVKLGNLRPETEEMTQKMKKYQEQGDTVQAAKEFEKMNVCIACPPALHMFGAVAPSGNGHPARPTPPPRPAGIPGEQGRFVRTDV